MGKQVDIDRWTSWKYILTQDTGNRNVHISLTCDVIQMLEFTEIIKYQI